MKTLKGVALGLLMGGVSAVFWHDRPTFFYQGLGAGIDWSPETSAFIQNSLGIVTLILLALGAARKPGDWLWFWVAGAVVHRLLSATLTLLSKDLEGWPISFSDYTYQLGSEIAFYRIGLLIVIFFVIVGLRKLFIRPKTIAEMELQKDS